MLELGAGMSGLAGLGLAACSRAAEVVITDGNPDALNNLEVGWFLRKTLCRVREYRPWLAVCRVDLRVSWVCFREPGFQGHFVGGVCLYCI